LSVELISQFNPMISRDPTDPTDSIDPIDSAAGLYVHVPFCKTKCPYCDFYSVTDLSAVESWLEAIEKEVKLYEGCFGPFDSLYIGGGTPSVLEERQVGRLMEAAISHFSFLEGAEITVEVNPDDVSIEKMIALRRLGVNRISIGVQSFNERRLRFLKRRHSAKQAEEAIGLAKASGFSNVGIDLMYGFPGQTRRTWVETLERAVSLDPAHLSCYQFTLEERTPYGRLMAEGRLKAISEEKGRALFLLTSRFLKERGFIHYEISNFAKDGNHYSRHNRKYWQHIPYLGLGPAAHSFRERTRSWNCRSVEEYCRLLGQGRRPVEGEEDLTPDQLRLEHLYLGFRTENGVSVEDVCADDAARQTLLRLTRSGFLKVVEGRVRPTLKGYLIADRLPLMFDTGR
jgi:putative oxygen-independent coproporphyrinogen III oxidase